MVICCALWPSGRLREFNRLGDYSYGLYVYAFPIQQVIASFMKGIQPQSLFGVSFFITLAFAVLSWHLVEKPMLALKDKRLPFSKG